MTTPPKAFIAYSHKNVAQRERLRIAIAVMENMGEIEIWCDAKILAGDEWAQKIEEKLEESNILLYLVSADSLASRNCNTELTDKLSQAPNVIVIPIILEHCDFKSHPLGEFWALPLKDGGYLPIVDTKWGDSSEPWQNVVDGIRDAIKSISTPSTGGGSNTPPLASDGSQATTPNREQLATLFNRANFFLVLGNMAMAISGYSKIIELNPNNAIVYGNRGIAHGRNGDYTLAISDFSKAIEINPSDAVAYSNRGNVHRDNGYYDRAIDDFNKAIEINPSDAVAYNNRGNVYRDNGYYNRAIDDFNKAIEIDPSLAAAYSNRGNAHDDKGDHARALADHNKAIEINPGLAAAYGNRGTVYGGMGDYEKAVADFSRAIELYPNYMMAYRNRGIVESERREYKKAREDLQVALWLAKRQGDENLAVLIQQEIDGLPAYSDS